MAKKVNKKSVSRKPRAPERRAFEVLLPRLETLMPVDEAEWIRAAARAAYEAAIACTREGRPCTAQDLIAILEKHGPLTEEYAQGVREAIRNQGQATVPRAAKEWIDEIVREAQPKNTKRRRRR